MSYVVKLTAVFFMIMLIIPVPQLWAAWVEDGTPVCTETGNQYYPRNISDGAGGMIVAWQDYRSGSNWDIYAQRIDDSGNAQWTVDGVAVCVAAGNQQSPQVASDGAGGVIIVWSDTRNGNQDFFSQRLNAAGVVQWAPDGIAVCTATGNQYYPRITSDGDGNAIITWQDYRSGTSKVYAQCVDASGVVQWAPDGIAICAAAGNQATPQIASDFAGGGIITWTDNRDGFSHIYAQRIDDLGVAQWGANGVAICTAYCFQDAPQIRSDGTGGAIITWWDDRTCALPTNWDIYAQRVSASGSVKWTVNGVAVCTTPENQEYPRAVCCEPGEAVITWQDYRAGEACDIYAQRLDSLGTVRWVADGVPVCIATHIQAQPEITCNALGGVVITWQDYRGGNAYDIYAQRLDTLGAPQWTIDGVPICTATGGQQFPEIVSDGVGGAIIAWHDGRVGPADIYAQRIYAWGYVAGEDAPIHAPTAILAQNYPNPFNPTTTIRFDLQRATHVKLCVYDVTGEPVATLVDEFMAEGRKDIVWNASVNGRKAIASGIYFYRLVAGDFVQTKKMVLLR